MIEKNKLLIAVLEGNLSNVRDCVLDGEDLHFKDQNGRNYLHLSVIARSKKMVKYFISEGLDVNECDNALITPLHRACRDGSAIIVKYLLDAGADPNIKAKNSIAPLHIAAAFGHQKCILPFLHNPKVELNVNDSENHTPLHYAAAEGHIDVVDALINSRCDPNQPNIVGNRPIHFAAVSGNPEICQRLMLVGGVDLDVQNPKGQTGLHLATLLGCPDNIDSLLVIGFDPNIKDMDGNTCLHLALKKGRTEVVEAILKDDRTDPSISDDEENTVLHLALKLGHFNLIQMMLPKSRDLTRQNSSGCTIIIEAIRNQLEDLAIEMLKVCPSLVRTALVRTATFDLVTPLHLAAERGMTRLTRELLISGAQVDAVDISGLTPSLYCAKNDSVLECLAMIEDIMIETETNFIEQNGHRQHAPKGDGSRISSRISS